MSKQNSVDEPLQWMYDGDKTDPEEYLLGKPVDSRTQIQKFVRADDIPGTYTVDMANKIREDPLFLMKKHELEETKKIMDNPFRIRRLKEMIEIAQSTRSERKLNSCKEKNETERNIRDSGEDSQHIAGKSMYEPFERRSVMARRYDKREGNRRRRSRSSDRYRDSINRQSRSLDKREGNRLRSRSNDRYRDSINRQSRSLDKRSGYQNLKVGDRRIKYSKTEMEAKLSEMRQNGQWREAERSANVAKSLKRISVENRIDKPKSDYMISASKHSMTYTSVEDNIRRNPKRYQTSDRD